MTTISFEGAKNVGLNDQFLIKVVVDTADQSINALSGKIVMPNGLSVEGIQSASSFVSLWIENPTVGADGDVTFSGIVPGGFMGKRSLFELIVKAETSANKTVSATDIEVRANDANATLVQTKVTPFILNVSTVQGTSTVAVSDTIAPESFQISIGKDDSVFEGEYFASFATQDKQTGVDHYEVAFSYFGTPKEGAWQEVSSPYQIPNEGKGKILYVKAVDQAGNFQVEKIPTPGFYPRLIVFSIIIVLIIWVLSAFFRRSRSKTQSPSLS